MTQMFFGIILLVFFVCVFVSVLFVCCCALGSNANTPAFRGLPDSREWLRTEYRRRPPDRECCPAH